MKDEKLESLSDKVRMGVSIGFMEALEVIEYQKNIKRDNHSIRKRFVTRIKNKIT